MTGRTFLPCLLAMIVMNNMRRSISVHRRLHFQTSPLRRYLLRTVILPIVLLLTPFPRPQQILSAPVVRQN